MKRKTKYKLVAGVLVGTIFLSGCNSKTLEMFRKARAELNNNPTTSTINPNEIEIDEDDFSDLEEKFPDVVVEVLTPQTETEEIVVSPEETTPITEETENVTEEVESIPEETTPVQEETISVEEETIVPEEQIPTSTEKQTQEVTEEIEETQQPVEEETLESNRVKIDINNYIGYTNNYTKIRTDASEQSLVISNLEVNSEVIRIFSSSNGYDLIKSNDYVGYVKSSDIDYTETDYIQPTEYTHVEKHDIVITTTTLNYRVAPNENSKRILTFAKNQELQVIAELYNGWLAVVYNGQIGYVHGDYVISMHEMSQNFYPELQLDELKLQKVVYSTTMLNFRCGSGAEFESLGLLEKYETLRVYAEYGDWYFVMTNDHNFGFVNKNYTKELEKKFVIVDKSEQILYLYNGNSLLYTTPVTTGKDSTPSDTGLFKILNKGRNVVLTDNETYWSPVEYWMRYNGGEGLHDASWRSVFGTESYHYGGSHGCINMPPEITDEIYETVEKGTKVLVHK